MAAYAAVVSLMNIVEQIQNHPRHSVSLDKKQTETLSDKVCFLEEFLENYSHGGSSEIEDLERQIASAAYAAEDVIESHIVDQIDAGSISLLDLQKVIEDINSVKEKVMKLQEERRFQDLRPTFSTSANSSIALRTEMSKMVGCDDELIQLMDMLTGQQSLRQIISIAGMGGIGKTTLARNAYEHPLIVHHFDIRSWVTISQEYDVKQILSQLLSRQGKSPGQIDSVTEHHLGEQLYKTLSGKRYLIILDDMWSVEVWDEIKLFFPDKGNGSRIVVTTRESKVVNHFGFFSLAKRFLDKDNSWNLFCEKVFAQEGCPAELEKIGKMIVKKCKGLPLSIVVMGGILRKSSRSQESWENVAKDVNSIMISGEDQQCFNILSFSYSYLPAHLKPCFLYMGVFPEDHEIGVSRLIRVWIAEGFLKPNEAQSLEEVAEDYFKDLVDRNLIFVRRLRSNGKLKTCYIHDILRDVCLRIAMREKFLCEVRVQDIPRGMDWERRLVFIDSNIPKEEGKKEEYNSLLASLLKWEGSLARSLTLETSRFGCLVYDGDQMSKFRLLRVLNVVGNCEITAIFQQFNLRYLDCRLILMNTMELPSSISLLWNVQTLISRAKGFRSVAPCEFWEMTQLRHLVVFEICLPNPPSDPPSHQQDGCVVLRNLQTLKTVVNFRLSEEVCKRIPNIKKLYLRYEDFSGISSSSDYCLYNLGLLHKLESLNCSFGLKPNRCDLLESLALASSLKKLTLSRCFCHWEDLTMIGSLPHLEVLKLEWWSVIGPEWNPVEGQFLRLKFLKIEFCNDLIHWNADTSHFPVLESIVLKDLDNLDEIPSSIGEIQTLRFIDLDSCSESAAISAMKILEEQESLGNEGLLQIRVRFMWKRELESFKEKVEQELDSFTSNNFRLEYDFS